MGIKKGVIYDYLLDPGRTKQDDLAVYRPNIELLNAKIDLWKQDNIQLGGIFHSHFLSQPQLSSGDIEYIYTIFRVMPPSIKYLFFPVVLPGVRMLSFKAVRRGDNVNIYEDKINIIKEYKT